jgi:hypothetical protein
VAATIIAASVSPSKSHVQNAVSCFIIKSYSAYKACQSVT